MLIRLVIKQAFRDGDLLQLPPESVPLHPCYRPPRKYLQRWCFDIYRRRYSLFRFNSSGFQADVAIGRLATNRPNQAIHRFTATIFQLQRQAAVGIFHHRFRDGVGMQLWACPPSLRPAFQRSSGRSCAAARCCCRTQTWHVFRTERPLITPASST